MFDLPPAPAEPEPDSQPRPARRAWPHVPSLALFVAGAAVVLAAVLVYEVVASGPPPLSARDVDQAIASALASQTPGPALSEAAYAAVRPSLVLVRTVAGRRGERSPIGASAAGSSSTPTATS